MSETAKGIVYASDIAFSPQVKAEQEKRGSRAGYQRMAESRDFDSSITPDIAAILAEADSFFMATASADGQPTIQHRGGPKGFLQVLDNKTLGFADYSGNRQYISVGNLAENPKAHLFIMNYARRKRLKIWCTARVVEDDSALIARLMPKDYSATPERAILFSITAWDRNCPQHIPLKFDAADVERGIMDLQRQIAALQEENAELRAFLEPRRPV
ncbi:MAG: pyridoxamine 5'-phosphate oxidase family protein [Rhizobiales bacterium]|nr:pyridoxamine 5'-phosphate oxidase family protein [Hyphomicrobiales bacterium]